MVIKAGGLVDVADFGSGDSVSVSAIGGAGGSMEAWLEAGVAGLVVSITIGTATHNTLIGVMPPGFEPPFTVTIPLAPNSANPDTVFCWVEPNGNITLFMYGAGSSGTALRGNGSWPRLVP